MAKIKEVVYVCGLPECRCKVLMPDHGEMVKYPHRDLHGFRCNGLLVKFSLTTEGKQADMDWMHQIQMARQKKLMRRPG